MAPAACEGSLMCEKPLPLMLTAAASFIQVLMTMAVGEGVTHLRRVEDGECLSGGGGLGSWNLVKSLPGDPLIQNRTRLAPTTH